MAAVFKFKADGSQYTRGLNQMRGQTQKFAVSVKSMIAGAFAGAGITGIKTIIDDMTELGRTADRLGVGVEMFQKLAYAAKQSGVDTERLADAMKDLDVKLTDGIARGGSFAELIEELGMDMNKLAAMPADQRMLAFADAIQDASGSLSRFGADEFGDAMFELLPLLEKGSEGILKIGESATTMSKEQIAAAERASMQIDGVISNMVAQLSIWVAEIGMFFEVIITGATQAAIEVANVWKPISKLIAFAISGNLVGAKKAFDQIAKQGEGAADRVKKAMTDIMDEQIESSKETTEESGMTAAERARRKAESDARKKAADEQAKEKERINKLDKQIADEQQRRKENALSLEEKLAEATRQRIKLEGEAKGVDPFSEEGTQKQLEIEKALTKEQDLQQRLDADLEQFFEGIEILDGKDGKDADLALPQQDPQAGVIASSLAAIGGGGGIATFGNDPMLNENKKQTGVLEEISMKLDGATLRGADGLETPEL